MSIKIRSDHLGIVQNILKANVPECDVLAFGSRVTGAASDASDLDLCIISETRISFEMLGLLRDAFSESNLPYKVDVIDWAVITPDFRKIVSANSFKIQSGSKKLIP